MNWSKLLGGLGALVALAVALGGVYSLAMGSIVLGSAALPFARTAAYVTLALVVVATAIAVVFGSSAGGERSTPYW